MSSYRSRIRQLMMRLSLNCGQLPHALFLQGVQCSSNESIAGGSFSDIYPGTFQGKAVALKRIRILQTSMDSRKVDLKRVGMMLL